MSRVLGLDFGLRRVGAAISDPMRAIATPLEVYERRNLAHDLKHYQSLVAEHEVGRIVIGLPLHTSGREGTISRSARDWGGKLAEATGVTVVFFDERYTSVEAEDALIAVGLKRRRRKGLLDKVAAQILLQSYLDAGCPDTESPPAPLADSEPDEL